MQLEHLLNRFYHLIKTKSTVPRWIIFVLDLAICDFALFYAFILRFNMDISAVFSHGLVLPSLSISILNVFFFKLFRTSKGIIRLSGFHEALRCISAVFCSSLIILLTVPASSLYQLPYLVPVSVLFIYFFTASFLLFAYRLWIKELYHRSIRRKLAAENVLIFGKTHYGAFMKNAVESIEAKQYVVSGFIDPNEDFQGRKIDNVRIFSWKEAQAAIQKLNVKDLFFSSFDIDPNLKKEVIEFCLSKGVRVMVIPSIDKWVGGQLKTTQLKNVNIEDLLNRPSIKLAPDHVTNFLEAKRVLITGAAGSIGTELVKQVAAIDTEKCVLCDNRETALYELQYLLKEEGRLHSNVSICVSDVRNVESMLPLFQKFRPQIVFHAAAYKHVPLMELHPSEAIKNNVLGTKTVADLSVKFGVEKFVLISTDKAINPTNVMGATKKVAEMYVTELQSAQKISSTGNGDFLFTQTSNANQITIGQTKFITTRFGNVLGSNGSVIPRFQQQIDKGGPITVTHPEITRYFMTIPEACSLVLEAATMGKGGEVYIFDMGEPVKIDDLARKMIKLAGLIPDDDIKIIYSGLRPGEKLFEELLNNKELVIPTHHKKIMISKVQKPNFAQTLRHISELISFALSNENVEAVRTMKKLIPEYKSNNSIYQKLDAVEHENLIAASA